MAGLPNKLKILRWERDLKQWELAQLVECSPQFLCMVENGRREPGEALKKKLASIFGLSVPEVFDPLPSSVLRGLVYFMDINI